MKKLLSVSVAVLVLIGSVCAGDAVEPAILTGLTNSRSDSVTFYNATEYYRGATLRFTNCVLLVTNSVIQGLDGVTMELKWGTEATNHVFTPTVTSTNLGKWTLSLTVPTNWASPYIQIKITDALTNSYIYPWRMLHTKASM